MLTISQLASYAGVTVRAVRHYHAKGLLPEPERDHSGYRRYDAAAVVELIRIRTLAEAGVPLARVRELLAADDEDVRGGGRGHRPPPARGDPRAPASPRADRPARGRREPGPAAPGGRLPRADARVRVPGAADRGRARQLDPDRGADAGSGAGPHGDQARADRERDPARGSTSTSAGSPTARPTTLGCPSSPTGWRPSSRRRLRRPEGDRTDDQPISDDLIDLLDTAFVESFPCAPRLFELLEERGWTGWTNIRRSEFSDLSRRTG